MKTNKILSGCLLVLVLSICSFLALMVGYSSGKSNTNVAVSAPTAIPTSNEAPAIRQTVMPSDPTHLPKSQPIFAPTIQEMLASTDGMTDVQRDSYLKSIKGSRVDGWVGTISDVTDGLFGGFNVYIEMVSDNLGYEVSIQVSKEVALGLNKGQQVMFSGDVASASHLFGISISIENATIEPAK